MHYTYISPDNEYPRYIGDVQLDDPNFDGAIENLPEGWIAVEAVDSPEITDNQVAYEEFPVLENGVYKQVWKVREKTAEEKIVIMPNN